MVRALDEVIDIIGVLYSQLVTAGSNILGVYLIGQYLATPFFAMALQLANMGNRLNSLRHRVSEFEDWVRENITGTPIIQELASWGVELLRFIRNPVPFVINLLRQNLPRLFDLIDRTFETIRPHLERFLDTFIPGWRDVKALVIRFLGEIVQDFITFRSNSIRWVYDRLRAFSVPLGRFLADPDGWIKERVKQFFPELAKLILDPSDYVLDRLVTGLEKYFNRYLARLLKIIEQIINTIF